MRTFRKKVAAQRTESKNVACEIRAIWPINPTLQKLCEDIEARPEDYRGGTAWGSPIRSRTDVTDAQDDKVFTAKMPTYNVQVAQPICANGPEEFSRNLSIR